MILLLCRYVWQVLHEGSRVFSGNGQVKHRAARSRQQKESKETKKQINRPALRLQKINQNSRSKFAKPANETHSCPDATVRSAPFINDDLFSCSSLTDSLLAWVVSCRSGLAHSIYCRLLDRSHSTWVGKYEVPV